MNRLMTTLALFGASLPALAGITHWAVPAMSDVQRLPDAEPKDGEKGGVVRIVAAKGEYEPGSFVLCSDADLGKVKLELGEFKQVEGGRSKVEQRTDKNSTVQPSTSNLQPPVVFPKANLDLKVIKVWYQNKNGWFSYFGDTGFKLCPELLVNDEDLVRVDTKKEANYARLIEKDGRVSEHWINPPKDMDQRYAAWAFYNDSTFEPMKPNFRDAQTLQPVAFPKGVHKQFFLTVHVTKEIPAGLYRGEVKVKGGGEGGGGQRNILCSVPVEIKVLDFELPEPRGYQKPQLVYRVSSYNYYMWDIILAYNGGDLELAKRQFEAIMRNLAAHNQTIHVYACQGGPFGYGFKLQYEAQKLAGMCLKPMMYGGFRPDAASEAERATNACEYVQWLDRAFGHHDVYVSYGDEPSSEWQRKMRGPLETFQRYGLKFRIAGNEQTYNPSGYLWDWFNCAARPTDSTQVDLWSKTLDIPVAWYASQHIGAENPALNRRMYGMAPWLTGYTAIDNYAHHLGSWNDARLTYKPMCFTYGISDGVVDTLAWEGFREGVDDVRYATLMCRLAREAQERGDVEAKKAGGKALQYLAMFNKFGGDLNACRAEMIGYIARLRAVLAAGPQTPEVFQIPTYAEKLARATAELKEAQKTRKNVPKSVEKLVTLCTYEGNAEDAVRILEEAKLYSAAMGVYTSDYFKGSLVNLAPELKEKFLLERVAKADCPAVYRQEAYVYLRENYPEVAEKCADAFWGKNDRAARLKGLEWFNFRHLDWSNRYWVEGRHRTMLWAWRTAAKVAREEKVPLSPDARAVHRGIQDFCDAKDTEGLAFVADAVLATNKFTAAVNYRVRLARELLTKPYGTPEEAERAVRALDVAQAGGLTQKERVDELCRVASYAGCLNSENLVRGIDAYRRSLYKPQPRKVYAIRYSEKPVIGETDWAALGIPKDKMDRPFGGSMQFLVTDVATGNRGDVATGDRKQKTAPPEMQAVADENGVHFRFEIPEPKAREVQLKLAGAGSFEAYLGPGANTPYVCLMLTPGKRAVNSFNTTYDTEGERMLRRNDVEKAVFNTTYRDDRIVCTLDLDWSIYATHLPKDGDVWDFEIVRWGSAGGQCWNGLKTIHGRSTWGALQFHLTERQRLSIVRRQVFAAWANYKFENTAWRHEGCLKHWEDTETGDPAFHAAVVKPLLEKLEPYSKLMKADMSDEDLKKVYAEAYPTWANIEHVIGRLRAKYLAEKEDQAS